jgi:hypothetical protein
MQKYETYSAKAYLLLCLKRFPFIFLIAILSLADLVILLRDLLNKLTISMLGGTTIILVITPTEI